LRNTGFTRNSYLWPKKIFFPALTIWFGLNLFSSLGLAEDLNDLGEPDTIWVECGSKAVHDSGGWAAFTIYLKTDNEAPGTDIAGVVLPFYVSRSNPLDSAWLDTTVTLVFANSAFNDSGPLFFVNVDSVGLDGFIDLGIVKLPDGQPGPQNGTFVVAQLWIHSSDSTSITIDTTSGVTNSLLLVTSLGVGYVPIWKRVTCPVCVHTSPPGDANCGETLTLADAIYLVNYLFKSWAEPCCKVLGDANCDGKITLGDAIFLVNHIFKATTAPEYCP